MKSDFEMIEASVAFNWEKILCFHVLSGRIKILLRNCCFHNTIIDFCFVFNAF